MPQPWKILLCLLFITQLSQSCVSTQALPAKPMPDQLLQRRVQTWLGMRRDFLEKHWGIATYTNDLGQGIRNLEYAAGAKRKKKALAKAKANNLCKVIFTIDITGTVRGGQWSGDPGSCLSFVKEVPSVTTKPILVSL